MRDSANDLPPAIKDPDAGHPVAGAWRPMLRAVVQRFVEGDYRLAEGVPGVAPVDAATADRIAAYIADYGATLDALPDETWTYSEAHWADPFWDVYVDLWTVEEGRSDMVLLTQVVQTEAGPRLTIRAVYVP